MEFVGIRIPTSQGYLSDSPKVPVAHVDGLVPLLDPGPGESRHIPGSTNDQDIQKKFNK